jgi:NRPS condensation-like uncharacterized protein
MDYPAEIFDQVQWRYETNGFNDHQLHCVLRFEAGPDVELLRNALIASIEAIPILGARYVDRGAPRRSSLDPADFGRAFVVARTQAEFDDLVVARIDEGVGPQVRIGVLDGGARAVALNMNHMACDAAGMKSYLYFLCETYARLAADPTYRPTAIRGDRSMRGVLERFGAAAKLKALFAPDAENNFTGVDRFPLSESGEARPFILTRKLGRERTAALKQFGRARGATLNDVLLTGFCRCLFTTLAWRPGAELRMPMMVDMRRYLRRRGDFTALTNLTSMTAIGLDRRPVESFEATLARVKARMEEKKGGDIGLNGFVKLALAYRLVGDRIANRLMRRRLKNPLICMTNIGVLDSKRIAFGDRRPRDAFICGSIKHKPYFQLAVSSYDDELTFSVNQYGNAADRERIVSFLDDIDAELPPRGDGALAAAAGS